PVIVAGIRTACVWTVGMVRLSTVVGAPCLGNYIFSGLQARNTIAVLVGCFAAALLALALDGLIHLAEAALAQRRRALGILALAGLAIVGVGGSLAPYLHKGGWGSLREGATYTVGAKGFTEQYILGDLMARRLQDAG